jgi:cellulose synthase/poly-beta-1,6-N-acetylglucosamine synthase-like glycosyltransferase
MLIGLEFILLALVALVCVPIAVFVLQLLVATLPGPTRRFEQDWGWQRPAGVRVAVLIPAHNESANVLPTLDAILAQVSDLDRVVVVADNCSDDTAAQARTRPVEVVERFDTTRRGKGYALDHGWQHVRAQGAQPDHILILDADCIMHPGGLTALLANVRGDGRPLQALYLCHNTGEAGVKQRVSEFAWTIKNWARALGFARLGLACQLMGSGMLLPASCLAEHALASGHLVEDLQLGLALAESGMAPRFCDAALVSSTFPSDAAALTAQRTRWEHGHLAIITSALPAAAKAWARRPSANFAALILDAAVPPLTLLLFLAAGVTALAALWWGLTGQLGPLMPMVIAWFALVLSLILGWIHYGRQILSVTDMLRAISYLAWKLPVYVRFVWARQTEWVRTRRDRH